MPTAFAEPVACQPTCTRLRSPPPEFMSPMASTTAVGNRSVSRASAEASGRNSREPCGTSYSICISGPPGACARIRHVTGFCIAKTRPARISAADGHLGQSIPESRKHVQDCWHDFCTISIVLHAPARQTAVSLLSAYPTLVHCPSIMPGRKCSPRFDAAGATIAVDGLLSPFTSAIELRRPSPCLFAVARTRLLFPATPLFQLPSCRVGRRLPAACRTHVDDIRVLNSFPLSYASGGWPSPAPSAGCANVLSTLRRLWVDFGSRG